MYTVHYHAEAGGNELMYDFSLDTMKPKPRELERHP